MLWKCCLPGVTGTLRAKYGKTWGPHNKPAWAYWWSWLPSTCGPNDNQKSKQCRAISIHHTYLVKEPFMRLRSQIKDNGRQAIHSDVQALFSHVKPSQYQSLKCYRNYCWIEGYPSTSYKHIVIPGMKQESQQTWNFFSLSLLLLYKLILLSSIRLSLI